MEIYFFASAYLLISNIVSVSHRIVLVYFNTLKNFLSVKIKDRKRDSPDEELSLRKVKGF